MKKSSVKINAKINLTLDVLGTEKGYHVLSSLTAPINIYDKITLKKREDNLITLKCKGISCEVDTENNNAYKTAKKCVKLFDTNGVDIILDKKIPVGAGLGGSSADIAGVLLAFANLYNVTDNEKIEDLAKKLGSDVLSMLTGGYKIIQGVGDRVEKVNSSQEFYLILLHSSGRISSKDCYWVYDSLNKKRLPVTDNAVELLKNGKKKEFIEILGNNLTEASIALLPAIKENLGILSQVGKAVMTGSGSMTYAIFAEKNERDIAYKKLTKSGIKVIKAQTV